MSIIPLKQGKINVFQREDHGIFQEKVKESFLPSEKDVRGNIFLKKDQKTSKKYPRNFSQIKKRPL